MALVMTAGPALEPVTLGELKAHLRVDGSSEDALLASLILTSRLHIETALTIAMISQSWTYVLDRWPNGGTVKIPLSPLQSVPAVRVKNASGAGVLVPATNYLLDLASKPPRLVWNQNWQNDPGIAVNGIEIDLIAGFGAAAASVPQPLKHAIVMLAAHWFEHRDPVEIGSVQSRIPEAVADLIAPFRKIRL